MVDPDFTQTLYPIIEEKLGRKLSKDENIKFYWTSGMRKEWFYNKLLQCTTSDQAEQLFGNCHISVRNLRQPPLWKQFVNWICK